MGLENTLEIGGVCCVEQTAGNTLEYGKKEIPFICAALYAFQRPLQMQINPKLVVRSKEEETAGPKLAEKKPKTIRMR